MSDEARIRTTHVGSLPRPRGLLDLLAARESSDTVDEATMRSTVREVVVGIVAQQRDHGIDVVTDGEMSKLGFFSYVTERLGGLEHRPGAETVYSFAAEQEAFPEYYEQYFAQAMMGGTVGTVEPVVCTGPLVYRGQDALGRDLDNLAVALDAAGLRPHDAFVPSIAPSGVGVNEYYASEEEYFFAVADAMAVEYRAIVDAGFALQVDDPFLTEIHSFSSHDEATRQRRSRMYVEAVNHALAGIPAERVRFHTCYSINEGPRVFDVPLGDIVDLVLAVDARYYSFEAGNARHEHEYHLWEHVTLPDDKVLVPGVITHASNIVEHPELVAERLERFARLVGPERVMAGADCGFSSQATYRTEVHPTVMWAKFDALSAGAAMASERMRSAAR